MVLPSACGIKLTATERSIKNDDILLGQCTGVYIYFALKTRNYGNCIFAIHISLKLLKKNFTIQLIRKKIYNSALVNLLRSKVILCHTCANRFIELTLYSSHLFIAAGLSRFHCSLAVRFCQPRGVSPQLHSRERT